MGLELRARCRHRGRNWVWWRRERLRTRWIERLWGRRWRDILRDLCRRLGFFARRGRSRRTRYRFGVLSNCKLRLRRYSPFQCEWLARWWNLKLCGSRTWYWRSGCRTSLYGPWNNNRCCFSIAVGLKLSIRRHQRAPVLYSRLFRSVHHRSIGQRRARLLYVPRNWLRAGTGSHRLLVKQGRLSWKTGRPSICPF